jgi:hypothetical protein
MSKLMQPYLTFRHRVAVEADYQAVLRQAEELRQYGEEQNRELFAKVAAKPANPSTEKIRAKLKAEKIKFALKV